MCTKPTIDIHADSREIDRAVNRVRNALSVYDVYDDVLERLQPTHIITQTQCEVCAVSLRDVERSVASRLASKPKIISLTPNALADVWDDIQRVAEFARHRRVWQQPDCYRSRRGCSRFRKIA